MCKTVSTTDVISKPLTKRAKKHEGLQFQSGIKPSDFPLFQATFGGKGAQRITMTLENDFPFNKYNSSYSQQNQKLQHHRRRSGWGSTNVPSFYRLNGREIMLRTFVGELMFMNLHCELVLQTFVGKLLLANFWWRTFVGELLMANFWWRTTLLTSYLFLSFPLNLTKDFCYSNLTNNIM